MQGMAMLATAPDLHALGTGSGYASLTLTLSE